MKDTIRGLEIALYYMIAYEMKQRSDYCAARGKDDHRFGCCRPNGHGGLHIAVGEAGRVYEAWQPVWSYKPSDEGNRDICALLDLLKSVVYNESSADGLCRSEYQRLGCCRAIGHKGIHVALAGPVVAMWMKGMGNDAK